MYKLCLSDLGPGSEVRFDAGGDPISLPGALQEVAPRQVQGGGGEGGGTPEVRMGTLVSFVINTRDIRLCDLLFL